MPDATIQIHVPDALMRLGLDANDIQHRTLEWLVFSLFAEGRMSSGKAAESLGIPRAEFLARLRARGIAYVNYSPEEMADEFAAVDRLKTLGE